MDVEPFQEVVADGHDFAIDIPGNSPALQRRLEIIRQHDEAVRPSIKQFEQPLTAALDRILQGFIPAVKKDHHLFVAEPSQQHQIPSRRNDFGRSEGLT